MQAYFQLMRTLWERQFRAWQLAPWVVYTVGPVLVVGLAHLLLWRSEHAAWLIVFSGITAARLLSGAARNDFLLITYQRPMYQRIRLLENALIVLPILVLLAIYAVIQSSFSIGAGALVLGIVGMSMVWWTDQPTTGRALPSPFSRKPFEFTVGWRRYWWVSLLLVVVLIQGLRVENYELSAFLLMAIALTGCQIISEPEPGYYVWIHSLSPQAFLARKVKIGLLHQSMLTLPAVAALVVFFSEQWRVTLLLFALGLVYLLLWMMAKYALFPGRIHVGYAFVMAFGMIFFPTLLILIPIYYRRALNRIAIVLPPHD